MRAAASLCVELARSGGCDLLVPGERRPLPIDPALRAWPEAHVRIAVSDPAAGPMTAGRHEGRGGPLGDGGPLPSPLPSPAAARKLPDHPEWLETRGGVPRRGLLRLPGRGGRRRRDAPRQEGGMSALAGDRSVRIELVCFAALAVLASLQWTSLVAHPPAGARRPRRPARHRRRGLPRRDHSPPAFAAGPLGAGGRGNGRGHLLRHGGGRAARQAAPARPLG